jgi:hypothetical protein
MIYGDIEKQTKRNRNRAIEHRFEQEQLVDFQEQKKKEDFST